MKKEYIFEPYKIIGSFAFGTSRSEVRKALGDPLSTQMYGYPVCDSYLDDYDFFTFCAAVKERLKPCSFFPNIPKTT